MKSFASAVIIAVSAAVASAQITTDPDTGAITCAIPNGAYCAGDSLATNIIIRCVDGVGQPGNCNDNLAGSFPVGVNFSPCYQTSPTSGDAACSKNCIVQGDSGNYPGTLSLPDCTPEVPSTTSSASSTSSDAGITSSSDSISITTGTSSPASTPSSGPSISSNQTTATRTTRRTSTRFQTSITKFTTVGTGTVAPPNSGNGTVTTPPPPPSTATNGGNGGSSATATPVGPTSTQSGPPSTFTGGAIANSAGSALAVVGLVIAYFL